MPKATLKKLASKTIRFLARIGRVDLQPILDAQLGVLQWKNGFISGESKFISRVLPDLIKDSIDNEFIDVGANHGDYANELHKAFPLSRIHCFEPNPVTFKRLASRFSGNKAVKVVPYAVSQEAGVIDLFDYRENSGSGHASVYRAVMEEQHNTSDPVSVSVKSTSLDEYAKITGLMRINFLKIDTEGHELAVLKGCAKLIKEKRIDCVQFEFNEMNVISRVFLRDFYKDLPGFVFFRIHKSGLIFLGDYTARNEIFQFQNILAVSDSLSHILRPHTLLRTR